MLKITKLSSGKLAVYTPYDDDFVAAARGMGGKWEEGAWVFPSDIQEGIEKVLVRVFGVPSALDSDERCTVTVSLKDEVSRYKAPVTLWGHTLASARGRDSGARVGDGVSIISGEATSGGSMANWYTIIGKGSVIVIRDVPTKYLKKVPVWAKVEKVEETISPPPAPTENDSIQAAIKLLSENGYTVTKQ